MFYRFADFANYYPLRLKADEFMYDNFCCLGGKPKEKHPLSFVLQGSAYLDNWFGKGMSYSVKLSEISPDSVSFSWGDSCAQYGKEGKIRMFTEEQLLEQINDFGGTEDFMEYVSQHVSYIEVQLWDDSVIENNRFLPVRACPG